MSEFVVGAVSLAGAVQNSGTVTNSGTIQGGVVNPASGTVSGAWTVSGLLGTVHGSDTLAAAYSTTSTTAVSSGFGVSLDSPGASVEWRAALLAANNTAGDGATLTLYRSTAAIPAAGSAPGGSDTALASISLVSSAASQNQAAVLQGLDTGLAGGTTYYYYVAIAALTGGTAQLDIGTNLLARAIA